MSATRRSSRALLRHAKSSGGNTERTPAFEQIANLIKPFKLEQDCKSHTFSCSLPSPYKPRIAQSRKKEEVTDSDKPELTLLRLDVITCPSPTAMHLMISISDILERSVLPYFRALVPRGIYRDIVTAVPRSYVDQQAYTVIQIFLLTYTATNNLVNFDNNVNFRMLSEYLGEPICTLMHRVLSRPSQNVNLKMSAWKAMAETMFRAAIRSGDCVTTERLLTNPELSLDIDARMGPMEYCHVTAICYSAMYQHYEMVKLLIRLGADVNKTHEYSGRTALNCMIDGFYNRRLSHRPETLEIVRLLLQAGARLAPVYRSDIIDSLNVDLLKLLAENPASGARQLLFTQAGLHSILCKLDEDDVVWFLDTAHSTGSWSVPSRQLDTYCKTTTAPDWLEKPGWAPCLIDVATQRQHLTVMRRLVDMGIVFTSDTLVAAIRGQSRDLYEFLLSHGVETDCFSRHFNTTPVAEALRTGQNDILARVSPSGFLDKIRNSRTCCATFQAIVEAGDDVRLELLLKSNTSKLLTAECFLTALSIAIENDRTDLAILLLEAHHPTNKDYHEPRAKHDRPCRWDVNGDKDLSEPLVRAIRKRDLALVNLLFEHDFGWTMGVRAYHPTAMELATDWGDLSVIEELHNRGNKIGYSLQKAVQTGSMECIRLLLRLKATSFDFYDSYEPYEATVVQQTVVQGNTELLREILRYGFEPRDSHAFTLAIAQPSPILRVLIDAVTARSLAAQRQPRDFAFAHAALASAMAWDKLDHVRDLLRLGVPADICGLRSARLRAQATHGTDVSTNVPCFVNGFGFWNDDTDGFSWMSSIETATGDCIYGGVFSPLAVAILRDFEEDILILEEILSTGVTTGLNLNNAVFFSVSQSTILTKTSRSKYTALLAAILARRIDKIQLLLDYGADVNTSATGGLKRTPLQKAAEIGSWSIVELLLLNGAGVNAGPSMRGGATALQLAAIGGFIGIAELLIDYGADVLAPAARVHGRTALAGAAEHGRYDMVQFLAQQSPHTDDQFEAAIDYAATNRHHAVVELLRELRAERQVQKILNRQEQQEHKCPDCSKTFTRTFTLKRHRTAVHGRAQRARTFQCDLCPCSFSRKDIMTRHRETHTGDAHVLCPSCGVQFSRSDYLLVHLRKCERQIHAS